MSKRGEAGFFIHIGVVNKMPLGEIKTLPFPLFKGGFKGGKSTEGPAGSVRVLIPHGRQGRMISEIIRRSKSVAPVSQKKVFWRGHMGKIKGRGDIPEGILPLSGRESRRSCGILPHLR